MRPDHCCFAVGHRYKAARYQISLRGASYFFCCIFDPANLVGIVRLELTRPHGRLDLNQVRLPISPYPRIDAKLEKALFAKTFSSMRIRLHLMRKNSQTVPKHERTIFAFSTQKIKFSTICADYLTNFIELFYGLS